MAKVGDIKKFNGKNFKLVGWFGGKSGADKVADKLKLENKFVRVTNTKEWIYVWSRNK